MYISLLQEQYIYLYGALTKALTGKESMVREGEFLSSYNKLKIPNPDTGKTYLEEEFSVNIITQILTIMYSNIHCKYLSNVNVNDETISYLNKTNTSLIMTFIGSSQKNSYLGSMKSSAKLLKISTTDLKTNTAISWQVKKMVTSHFEYIRFMYCLSCFTCFEKSFNICTQF